MSFRPEDIDSFNKDVNQWTKETKDLALQELDRLGVRKSSDSKSSKPLRQAFKTAVKKKDGITSRVSFKLPRYAVFLHKGVGRGTTISQVGSTNRKAKPWLNPPIEKKLPGLEDIVADHMGTMVLNAVIIK